MASEAQPETGKSWRMVEAPTVARRRKVMGAVVGLVVATAATLGFLVLRPAAVAPVPSAPPPPEPVVVAAPPPVPTPVPVPTPAPAPVAATPPPEPPSMVTVRLSASPPQRTSVPR